MKIMFKEIFIGLKSAFVFVFDNLKVFLIDCFYGGYDELKKDNTDI